MTDASFDSTPVAYEAAAKPQLDPLRYCVMTTVALLAWLAGPLVAAILAGLGFAMYWRAVRAGLKRSRCVLRHPTLVLVYLALACAGALAGAWASL